MPAPAPAWPLVTGDSGSASGGDRAESGERLADGRGAVGGGEARGAGGGGARGAGGGGGGGGGAGGGAGGGGGAAIGTVRLTAWVRGRVQGVGFRWWVRCRARELGLVGTAENLADGRVKVVAEGARETCADLLGLLEGAGTPGRVAQVTYRWDRALGEFTEFSER